jgi:hypothetical protein
MLALTFVNTEDYDKIRQDDLIDINGLAQMKPGQHDSHSAVLAASGRFKGALKEMGMKIKQARLAIALIAVLALGSVACGQSESPVADEMAEAKAAAKQAAEEAGEAATAAAEAASAAAADVAAGAVDAAQDAADAAQQAADDSAAAAQEAADDAADAAEDAADEAKQAVGAE